MVNVKLNLKVHLHILVSSCAMAALIMSVLTWLGLNPHRSSVLSNPPAPNWPFSVRGVGRPRNRCDSP